VTRVRRSIGRGGGRARVSFGERDFDAQTVEPRREDAMTLVRSTNTHTLDTAATGGRISMPGFPCPECSTTVWATLIGTRPRLASRGIPDLHGWCPWCSWEGWFLSGDTW
jgi:hypothetical protein